MFPSNREIPLAAMAVFWKISQAGLPRPSMPPPHPPKHTPLPESLRLQLSQFRAHLWRIKRIEAIAAGLIGLLVSFLLVYGLDRVWPTPGWVRLIALLCGISLFAGFAPYWWYRWIWRQRQEAQLARLIAKKYPGLGDRLLGVIELEQQEGHPDSLSPRLREAAMIAVAAETGRRALDDAIPEPRHLKWALAAIVLALVAAGAFTLTPRAGVNALQRWLMPLSETERYTFTRLAHPPLRMKVPFGEAFEITLRLAADSEQRPLQGLARYATQAPVASSLDENTYRFRFPGQQDPGTVVFRIGDLRHAVDVEPVLRPAIETVHARVTPPQYLGMPPEEINLNHGTLRIVQGTRFEVGMNTTRPLHSGTYGPSRALASAEKGHQSQDAIGGALTIEGDTARTPELFPTASCELPFSWTDEIGLAGDGGFRIQVDVRADADPTCYLQGTDRQRAILPEETIDFEVLAEDDWGIRHVGLEWSGEFLRATDQTPAKGELRLGGGTIERRLLLPASFSPSAFAIAPQKLILRGYVEDALPGRGRLYSEPITLFILTRSEHAQLIKSRFDRQISELEDLARRELDLSEENQRIERLDATELQQEETKRRIQRQEQEESESTRRAEELKQQMEQLLQDALRNKDIDKKPLQRMADALKSMQELADTQLPQVQQDLQDAQKPSNTPEQAKKEMQEAVENQRRALETMRKAIETAEDANRTLEAGTFVHRLKKASQEQKGIVSSLQHAFEQLLGERYQKLDPSDIRTLHESTHQQSQTASDVRWIQEDLASYHARTGNESFLKVIEAMREAKVDVGLDEVRQLLAKNHSFRAAEKSSQWAARFQEWAALLEGPSEPSSGGGGGGGAPSPEDEDFEFMLRVMRMVQQEMDLRGRTRTLEQTRREQAHSVP